MLELKSKNLFIKSYMGHSVISKVLDFYDLIGKNILLLHDQNSGMSSWVKFNNQLFTPSTLKNIIENNLFRLDLIVIDTDTNQEEVEQNYKIIRQVTDLPVIFIDNLNSTEELAKINPDNFDTAYILSRERFNSALQVPGGFALHRFTDSDNLDDYLVQSLHENWKSNLRELKIQYIRDKNLRDLLGDNE